MTLLENDLRGNPLGRRSWNEGIEIHNEFKYEFDQYRSCAALCDVFERTLSKCHDYMKLLFNQKKTKEI